MRRSLGALTGVLLATSACDPPDMVSERGDFRLEVGGLVTPQDLFSTMHWPAPYLVLPGTRMCVTLQCDACAEDYACNDAPISASGPIEVDPDGCFIPTGPGEVEWSVGAPCGAAGEAPDRVRMRVVDPDDVATKTLDWIEFIIDGAALESPVFTTVGAPWLAGAMWPLQAVAGAEIGRFVQLYETGSGHGVAWERDAGGVEWTTLSGRAPISYPDEHLAFVAFEGTEAEASLRVSERTWSIGPVSGVAADAVTSLEISAILYHDEDPDAPLVSRRTYPYYARAIARDAGGAPVLGLPVTWSVEKGELAVTPEKTGEYVMLADECLPPEDRGGPREVVLRASHRDLSAAVTLRWTGAEHPHDPEWTPSPYCLAPEGCGCRASDPAAAALLVLGLLALRRRRKQDVSRVMSVGICLFVLPMTGCDEDDPPVLRAAEIHELGSLPVSTADEVGHSVRIGDRGLWLLHDNYTHRGFHAVTPDLDARDGLHPFEFGKDDEGVTLATLPLTADEADYNARYASCLEDLCREVYLWSGPVVHDPERDRLLLFYTKRIRREVGGEAEYVGSSIAVWRDDLAGRPVRPVLAEGSAEPTLIFGADAPRLAAAALVADDHVYAFACDGERNPCILARAPLARAQQRGAWQFYGEGGLWTASPADALPQFDGAPTLSVHHSAYGDAFVAVHAVPGTTRVVVRTAQRLEGPWSDPGEIHRAWQAVPAVTIDSAMIHPELTHDGGRVDYLTYHADPGGLQLVEIRWE